MKRTLNVNIGSVAFTIDEDGYHVLKAYYDDIRSRLYENERSDVMEDVENRTAVIFRENLTFPTQVVTMDLVKKAIAVIGSARTFGERQYDPPADDTAGCGAGHGNKLYRSRMNKVFGGVCGGLAYYLNTDPVVIRLVFILSFFLFVGLTFWAYIIMWIVVPIEPYVRINQYNGRRRRS